MPTVNPEAIPEELRERDQWLLWNSRADRPRRPHWRGDFAISWSDPDDWHSFPEALAASQDCESWGIGYVMALDNDAAPRGVYACLDLDGCLAGEESPEDWLPSLEWAVEDDAYIERSPSGDGLHIPLFNPDVPEWWSDSHFSADEHQGVELLTNKFCTFTGDRLGDQDDGVTAADPTEFLYEAYQTLNGEAPRDPGVTSSEYGDDIDRELVEELLGHVSSNCDYPTWRNILFALHDWDSGAQGKSVAKQWSRGPSWDDDSERLIESIWDRSETPSDPVTVGTLFHHARQNGWEPEQRGTDGPPSVKELVARYSDEFDDPEAVPDVFAEDGGENAEAGDEDDVMEAAAIADSEVVAGDVGGAESAVDDAESPESGSETDGGTDRWQLVYQAYAAAEDADERLPARHKATEALVADTAWRCIRENDSLWSYDAGAGIYREDGESRVRSTLVEHLKEQFRAHEANEIGQQIRGRFTVSEQEIGGPSHHVATENCVLEIERGDITVHDHDPGYEFIGRVQTPYRPEADCPRFEAFLRESVDSDTARQTLQEYAGYCLMHWDLPYHKALFLVGPTASGKSTFLDTIRAMLGEDAVSSLTPQQMTGERFGGAELYGTWANIRNDIPAATIDDTGQFKEITAGDPIKAEKKYEDPFMFQPNAKHMFSANELPDADTDDEAFFRRILLIAFPTTVPRGERDPALQDKLKQELPGILNWALDGLQRLLKNGRFSQDRMPGRTQQTWEKWGNSVARFEQACLDEGDEAIPKSDIYQAYISFCEDEGIPTETQHKMTRELKLEGYRDGQARVDGSKERVFTGVEWTGRGKQYRDRDDEDAGYNGGGSLGDY